MYYRNINGFRTLFLVGLVVLALVANCKRPDVKTEEITYGSGDVQLKGYLAYDAAKSGPRPGILVVHEWWGHNDYARRRARMLAELGYTALAVDMYGDGKNAAHPDDAGKFAGAVMANFPVARQRFEDALKILRAHETVGADSPVAAIGYCFGGGVVLNMARQGVDLDGVVSFHGSLGPVTPAQPGQVKAKVLVLHGADDTFVPQEAIDAFKAEMEAAGVDYEFIAYPGAVHAFTNPAATENGKKFDIPLAYNEEADKKSWEEMKSFLKEVLGQ